MLFRSDIVTRLRDPAHRIPWVRLFIALVVTSVLAGVGFLLTQIQDMEQFDKDAWWLVFLRSWQEGEIGHGPGVPPTKLIALAMGMWIGFAALLLVGLLTRFAAVMTWMLSLSFMNANYYLDNAGDTVRIILLFYLMLDRKSVV